MEKVALGIDLGGTAIKFAAVTETGNIIATHHAPTEAEHGLEHVIENMMRGIAELIAQTKSVELSGIGIGVPGVVSLDGGTVSHPPNLPGWEVVRLGDAIAEKFRQVYGATKPVFVENDANLAALGEARFGAGTALNDFIMITLGTGIGAGIIINRKIFRGTTGAAGEFGHIPIDYNSETAHAGIHGSVEGFIGQRHIAEYARKLAKNHPDSLLHQLCPDLSQLEPKHITAAAEQGDPLALAIWQWVAEILGAGLGAIVSILDIRKFVIGGGVAGAGKYLFEPCLGALKRFTLSSMHEGIELLPAKLGNQAGVMGAAAQAL
ncbi:ROK family protein [Chloroherpeton thalassium ATCC 35110]|uniref:ROK family protein n=1 Tax=Chloroherpeton thalassium (strain ATCC 35110 / GB-78) TaxID=517418 RepID=B3QWD2_CHLT3|nr:ROK family protein [Chloroherpeton thalassium]ACF13245.1 ROK family protein [Chloroherpeton thalassium ATCC 35110]